MTARLLTAVAAVALTCLTGCSTLVTGTARLDPSHTPGQPVPTLLDTGNYPTKPSKPMGTGGPDGSVLEGQRMADFVVGPWEVDAALTNIALDGTMVWKNAAALKITLAAPAPDVAGRHGFLVGFTSGRSSEGDGPRRALFNGVMRFGTPADASAAAAEMGAPTPGRTPIGVPDHPDAVATAGTQDDGTTTVSSFTPHGSYVFYGYVRAQGPNPDGPAALVAKAVDLQAGRIDAFTPTDPAKFADLPIDPTGLLTRTLPTEKGKATIRNGSWGPHAALHFSVDPVASARMFDDGKLQQKTYGRSMVFQSAGPADAKRLYDAFLADHAPGEKPADGVSGLPAAACADSGDDSPLQPRFTCTLIADRYVAVVASGQLRDAHQQASAQYLLLTAQ